MISLGTILVATDFSEPSECAVKYGRALAEAFRGSLHVIHVVPDSMALPWATMADGLAMTDVQKRWEAEARERLARLVADIDKPRVPVELTVRAGDPVRQITAYARDQAVDLIVLGTHGRGPVAHMLMGSVAERVVRTAPCPVLTVRHPQHEFVMDGTVALVPVQEPAPVPAPASA
jgi:universal stress protein A